MTPVHHIRISELSCIDEELCHEEANLEKGEKRKAMLRRAFKYNHYISDTKWFWDFPQVACEITYLGHTWDKFKQGIVRATALEENYRGEAFQ